MEHGLRLPWWEFRPADFALPGTVVPHDSREEGLLAGFLQAGARAETADCFVSANSLNVAGVLDALSQEELVLPAARSGLASCRSHQTPHRANLDSAELPQLACRSRLFGMPLADRHAALTVACSLRHRLPRRALVNFFCRLILGKDLGRLPPGSSSEAYDGRRDPPTEQIPPATCRRQGGGRGLCVCGGQLSSGRNTRASPEIEGGSAETQPRHFVSPDDVAAAGGAAAAPAAPPAAAAAAMETPPPTACRSCLGRRAWLDPGSARLLVVACHNLLWDKALPEDEALALDRCLRALSEVLGDRDQSRRGRSKRAAEEPPAGGGSSSSGGVLPVPASAVPEGRVRGVSAVRAGVRRRRIGSVTTNSSAVNHAAAAGGAAAMEGRSAGDAGSVRAGSVPRLPASATTRGRKNSTGGRGVGSARATETEPSSALADRSEDRAASGPGEAAVGGGGASPPPSPSRTAAVVAVVEEEGVGAAEAPSRGGAPLAGGEEGNNTARGDDDDDRADDCLPSVLRQRVATVAEKVAAAGARGAASTDVQGAAAAAVSLLREATKLPSNTAPAPPPTTLAVEGSSSSSGPFSDRPRPQLQQPLEAVCSGVGLDLPRGKGATATAGCGDDLVMAVCDGFVTPALSLRNCLAFVRAVLVPRARALTAPASRLLVTAVSGIGKARPEVVIDGLVLPLLCGGDPASAVGSAQCELCTRLIKQILPKDTLEAVLVGLCGPPEDESAQTAGGWIGGPSGGSGGNGGTNAAAGRRHVAAGSSSSRCVWTELTVPVMTTALNLKPALSDRAIAALVRGVEAAAERAALQKSLKFTTLIHSLVTRYGPQLKLHVPALRTAVGRCSTFMVKAVLAALQRLEK